ncbi:MAG: 50S ribosomal protein L15 [Parcubacteria group bacterium]|nr:50S ribosomal protein L15 [Parcubacteria group bacterium]
MTLSNLKAPKGLANKKRMRLGRGDSSGKGSYSGRGQKGQSSRSGVGGLALKGLRRRLLSIPKLGGFNSLYEKTAVVNLSDLEKHFETNARVSPDTLIKKGLIDTHKHGVKILSKGSVTKPLKVVHCKVSETARKALEKAGGTIV